MNRKCFTDEQVESLRQNPFVYCVTDARVALTKEFKEIFFTAYREGQLPRKILEDHGFDTAALGDRRVWNISYHIREEYRKYGEFHEGFHPRKSGSPPTTEAEPPLSEAEELKQLRHEVEYLKQEIEFIKKISSIRSTRK